jgi:hypothetical protein
MLDGMGPLLLALALLHGTHLPREGWTATALVTIRQRLNMNAVRVVDGPAVEDLVRLANRLELTVIIESDSRGRSTATSSGPFRRPRLWRPIRTSSAR